MGEVLHEEGTVDCCVLCRCIGDPFGRLFLLCAVLAAGLCAGLTRTFLGGAGAADGPEHRFGGFIIVDQLLLVDGVSTSDVDAWRDYFYIGE